MGLWKDRDGNLYVYPRENKEKALQEEIARLFMLEEQVRIARKFILRLKDSTLVEGTGETANTQKPKLI